MKQDNKNNHVDNWNFKKSKSFYNIDAWGNSFFDINSDGNLTVKRSKYLNDKPIELIKITDEAKKIGIATPMLLRFTDIIKTRAERIFNAFNKSLKKNQYTGKYTLIYPIKVNSHKSVIDSFLSARTISHGLEAGSKAELLAVLYSVHDNATPIICNGYKDKEYIKLALIAKKLGRNITIVLEKMLEAKFVIEISEQLQIKPLLGVRFRLALTTAGKWAHSGGEKSKFGFNTTQLLELIKILNKHNLLEFLHLLHCHQGSQIANLKDIQYYINELSYVYVELCKLNIPIKIIDLGGGLAVDYEGSRTRNFNSKNYSLGEYANTIIKTIKEIASKNNVKEPDLYSESGRAICAHHAVFVTNIIESEDIVGEAIPKIDSNDQDLIELKTLIDNFEILSLNEVYFSACVAIENIHKRFNGGMLSLEQRALAEQLFSHIKIKILKNLKRSYRSHRELYDILDEDLAKKIICNFSLFQSMPDVWAISQMLPIMPLNNLGEEPKIRAILEDITCDSDGKIANYMDYQGNEPSLKLPQYNEKSPYLLAFFLVGAYQEIMGNLHNLFGPVNTLDIGLDKEGHFTIKKIHKALSKADILKTVEFNSNDIIESFNDQLNKSNLDKETKQQFFKEIVDSCNTHTYLI